MLDVDNVIGYLLERRLIEVRWIIDGTLNIRSVARRNRNLLIEGPDGLGFLLKQPDDPDDGGRETLRREAAFHMLCRAEPAGAPITPFLPRLIQGPGEDVVLIFERIPGAKTMQAHVGEPAAVGCDIRVAGALGRAVGTVHRVFGRMDLVNDPRLAWLPRARPWVLSLHEPGPAMLASLSPANLEIVRILQMRGILAANLERSREHWRPRTVIHGDIRLDNVLVRATQAGDEPDGIGVWVTDWEMVRLGDPAWDVAGALQDFVVAWVSSMPISDQHTVEEIAARAKLPLVEIQALLRSFWSGYRRASGIDDAETDEFLLRAVVYASARLVQSAYEGAAEAEQLPGSSVLLLQIGENLATDPGRGAIELLGIPPGYIAS